MLNNFKLYFKTYFKPLLSSIYIRKFSILTLSVITALGFLFLSKQVFSQNTEAFDNAILQYFLSIQSSVLDRIFVIISLLGKTAFLIYLGLGCCIFLLVKKKWIRSMIFAIAVVGSVWFKLFLKDLFGRERPELWERIIEVRYLSYPSGHAMISIVVYGLICYFLITQFKAWRGIILAITSMLLILIGISRLYLGVHWLTDIIAGYTVGFVCLMTCILSLEMIEYLVNHRAKIENK